MARQTKTQFSPQEDVRIQEFLDMTSPFVIKFNIDHMQKPRVFGKVPFGNLLNAVYGISKNY